LEEAILKTAGPHSRRTEEDEKDGDSHPKKGKKKDLNLQGREEECALPSATGGGRGNMFLTGKGASIILYNQKKSHLPRL